MSAPWSRADAASYDEVAPAFDRFAESFSASFAERLVRIAALAEAEAALDVATGTGIVAAAAARAVGPAGKVVAVDLSGGMLAAAAARLQRDGLSTRVELRMGDAQALELPDESCDAALCLFGLLHFLEPRAALLEMRRVLRPGGRLALAVGSPPPLPSWAALRRAAGRAYAALRGGELLAPQLLESLVARLPSREAETTPLASGFSPWRVPRLVRSAGFSGVRSGWAGQQASFADGEEFWELQRTLSSLARKRLAGASAEAVAAVKSEFLERCRRARANGGVLVYRSGALFVSAVRG